MYKKQLENIMKKPLVQILATIIGLVGAFIVATFVTYLAGVYIFSQLIDDNIILNSLLSLLVYIIILFIIAIPLYKWRKINLHDLGITRFFKLKYIAYAFCAFFAYTGVMILVNFAVQLIPGGREIMQEGQNLGFATHGNNLSQLVLIFITLVILPAICEELIFRGFLFGQIEKQLNHTKFKRFAFWSSTIITSIAFAIAHLQLNIAIDVFFLSIIMCYLRRETGSIYTGIILHMIKNGLAFVIMFGIIHIYV